jgi:hypothetical protein
VLKVAFEYSGLVGPSTVAHIHARSFNGVPNLPGSNPPVTPVGWPIILNFGTSAWIANAQSGSYARTFDLTNPATYFANTISSFTNPSAVPASPAALAAYMEKYLIDAIEAPGFGNAYLNIHSALPNGVPTGEIWGRTLAPAMVSTNSLLGSI